MKKYHIRILLIVIVPLILMGLVALMFSHKDKKYSVSFIVNGVDYWQFRNNSWNSISVVDDIGWNKYNVYSSNKYINDYYVTINNGKSYFFDSNDDSYEVEMPYIAILDNSDVRLLNYNEEEMTSDDFNNINAYLKKMKINYQGEYSVEKKFITDINSDNRDDYLYIISNELYTEENVFYIVFVKCNNKYITIDSQIDKKIFIHYELAWILNMMHDGYNNIILTYPREYDTKYYLYTYNIDEKNYYNVFED